MTPAKSGHSNVVVVDGSNIATEGRSTPSLAQLNDAVLAFREDNPDAVITVVVDATFGHRIDKKELGEFDAAVAHNELVAPPAGAIGRGDAFVLSIANKVGARILSNDSFQEFHGEYPWLFDEGRLIGGKPVPYVGWVFVERLPVKGAVSRKATRAARGGRESRPSRRSASKEASLPMPVPTTPPPVARRGSRAEARAVNATPVGELDELGEIAPPNRPAPTAGGPVNDLLPFLDFVEHHPVGSSVNGVVESYSSHGAYVNIGDLRGYVPLRLMGDPPPRSAREMMKIGDAVTLVVTSFAPARRSVDLAIPKVAPVTDVVATRSLDEIAEAVSPPPKAPRKRGAKRAAPEAAPSPEEALAAAVVEAAVAAIAAEEEHREAEPAPALPPPAKKAAAKKGAAKKAATKAPAKKTAAKKVATKRATATKEAAAPTAPVKKAATKKAPAKKAAAMTAPAEKSPATKAAAKKSAPRKAATKRAAVMETV